jgi:diacylglycerol kinase family enzyme
MFPRPSELTVHVARNLFLPRPTYEARPIPEANLAAMRLGVVVNPNAGRNRRAAPRRAIYEEILDGRALVRETTSAEGLREVVAEFARAGVTAIAFDGGDGTFGTTITEAAHVFGEALPAFIPLRGGSYNSTARALRIARGSRRSILRHLRLILERGEGRGQERSLHAFRVSDPKVPRDTFGFVLSTGVAYDMNHYLASIGGTSQTNAVIGFLRLVGNLLLGTRLGETLWRPWSCEVDVDGRRFSLDGFKILVCTSVHRLLPVVRPSPPPPPTGAGEFSYIVSGLPREEAAANAVRILWHSYQSELHATGHTAHLTFSGYRGGYVLDGELHSLEDGRAIAVSPGVVVRVWEV